ncbi:hypothetical protein UlMin_045689 [Ulmus minor]
MNNKLLRPFTSDEVHKALLGMHPTKALGIDGLPALFYQNFWDIVGPNITKVVLTVLNNQGDVSKWNETLITLISKVKMPKSVKEYRPIRLSMHWIRQHRGGKTGYAALKLYMSKVYDRVEWQFLEGMMIKLGFATQWVELVMHCASWVSYSFLINREVEGLIFCRAKMNDCTHLRGYLDNYSKVSGQLINFDKSALSFSTNTLVRDRNAIYNLFGIS